jgi:hypothetical protein
LAAAVIACLFLAHKTAEWWTESWWFRGVSQTSGTDYHRVYLQIFWSRCASFFAGAALFLVVVGTHRRIANRIARNTAMPLDFEDSPAARRHLIPFEDKLQIDRVRPWLGNGLLLFLAFLTGSYSSLHWIQPYRLWGGFELNQHDPIFNRDHGFYLFQLPALNWLWGLILACWLCALLWVVAIYAYEEVLELGGRRIYLAPEGLRHLSVLLGGWLVWRALGHFLDRYNLIFGTRGSFAGVGYTDIHWRIPALLGLSAIALVTAWACWWWANRGQARRVWRIFGSYWIAWLLLSFLFPSAIELWYVRPRSTALEGSYQTISLQATRQSFGLDAVKSMPTVTKVLSPAQVRRAVEASQRGLPTWPVEALQQWLASASPAGTVYTPLQLDVYRIGRESRPVYVATRETSNTQDAFTAKHTLFICDAVRTNAQGQPLVYSGAEALNIVAAPTALRTPVRPLVFGAATAFHGRNATPNPGAPGSFFDRAPNMPLPSFNVTPGNNQPPVELQIDKTGSAKYFEEGGIKVPQSWKRLLLWLRFGDGRVLPGTSRRVLWHRSVVERCRQIAPFLVWTGDEPLPVRTPEGRLVWLLNGYVLSATYPYAQALEGNTINYLRSPVAATIDAHNGSVKFFVTDPDEPLLRFYRRFFSSLWQPLDAMPRELRSHLNPPQRQLAAQANIWSNWLQGTAKTFEARWQPLPSFNVGSFFPNNDQLPVQNSVRGSDVLSTVAFSDSNANIEERVLTAALSTTRTIGTNQVTDQLRAWIPSQPLPLRKLLPPSEKSEPRNLPPIMARYIFRSPLLVAFEPSLLVAQQSQVPALTTEQKVPLLGRQWLSVWYRGQYQSGLASSTLVMSPLPTGIASDRRPSRTTPEQRWQQTRQRWQALQKARREGDWAQFETESRALDILLNPPTPRPTNTPQSTSQPLGTLDVPTR